MSKLQLALFAFVLGFGAGILTFHLHSSTKQISNSFGYQPTRYGDINWNSGAVTRRADVNLDPFPLPACNPNRTSAVYTFYGHSVRSPGAHSLFNSIKTLLKSNFPGRVRVIIDQKINDTIRDEMNPDLRFLLNEIELHVVAMPDLNGKELIPHSNKIRALQAGALVHGNDSDECTVSLDYDTHISSNTPWNDLLSTLQLNDFAVAHDCDVPIVDVPAFLKTWMPNTGVLALRNTPRTRMVLRDWLHHYKPCNATHISTCTPGTDQYPFLQLVVKHAARLHKLDNSWNCRIGKQEIDAGIEHFPVYSLTILSNRDDPESQNNSLISKTCGGHRECFILHGHWLRYP